MLSKGWLCRAIVETGAAAPGEAAEPVAAAAAEAVAAVAPMVQLPRPAGIAPQDTAAEAVGAQVTALRQ